MPQGTRKVKVVVDTRQEGKGLDAVRSQIGQFKEAVTGIGNYIKQGLGIDLVGRFVSYLQQVPQVMMQAVREGINFNALLETSQLGLAAILKQFQPETFSDWQRAMRESATLIDELKVRSREVVGSFSELMEAYQTTAGAMFMANIPLEKQVGLVIQLAQALAGIGRPMWQLPQEVRALMEGRIDRNAALAMTLGITGEDIATAKEQGRLYEFLMERTSAFGEAGKRAAETMHGLTSNIKDLREQLTALLTENSFETLRGQLRDLFDELSDPKAAKTVGMIGTVVGQSVSNVLRQVRLAIEIYAQYSRLVLGPFRAIGEGAQLLGAGSVSPSELERGMFPDRIARRQPAGHPFVPDFTAEEYKFELQRQLELQRWFHRQGLIDLQTYLSDREKLIRAGQEAGAIDWMQAIGELDAIRMEGFEDRLRQVRSGLAGGLQGIFAETGQDALVRSGRFVSAQTPRMLDMQVNIQRSMLTELRQIRQQLTQGILLEAQSGL